MHRPSVGSELPIPLVVAFGTIVLGGQLQSFVPAISEEKTLLILVMHTEEIIRKRTDIGEHFTREINLEYRICFIR
jgi:hypothetical protein